MALIPPKELMRVLSATANAKNILKPGDKIRAVRSNCSSRVRSYTFERWDGNWIVSRSGVNDIAAISIDLVNGIPVDFTLPCVVSLEEAQQVYAENQRRMNQLFQEPIEYDRSVPF